MTTKDTRVLHAITHLGLTTNYINKLEYSFCEWDHPMSTPPSFQMNESLEVPVVWCSIPLGSRVAKAVIDKKVTEKPVKSPKPRAAKRTIPWNVADCSVRGGKPSYTHYKRHKN